VESVLAWNSRRSTRSIVTQVRNETFVGGMAFVKSLRVRRIAGRVSRDSILGFNFVMLVSTGG
jgi:hypothetical protein